MLLLRQLKLPLLPLRGCAGELGLSQPGSPGRIRRLHASSGLACSPTPIDHCVLELPRLVQVAEFSPRGTRRRIYISVNALHSFHTSSLVNGAESGTNPIEYNVVHICRQVWRNRPIDTLSTPM
ncbi:unnamed protein product [Pleuronectes platessa]|uniref:Secreted protein n=1 Tax=Pleuronectes platessa TaxID=8262 RepID=A0A9N7TQ12_PLEPL|nr:unnamed protein product [Pleuronectes platessa]